MPSKNKIYLISSVLVLAFFMLTAFHKKQPKVLIIGDSISIGYTPFVKNYFSGKAMVFHNEGNAQHTGTGLDKVEEWIGNDNWDVIQFNWGLWDLCYRHPDSKESGNRDKIKGKITYTVEEYASNLETIVSFLKTKTKAKLIFVTTTYVPDDEPGRYQSDVQKYNEAAKIVMKKHGILVNDIYKQSIDIHKKHGNGATDVHYSKKGYTKLSTLIINFLKSNMT